MPAFSTTLLCRTMRAAVLATAGLSLCIVTLVQASGSSAAQVLAQQRAAKAGPDAMRRCMATWDRSAQMTKQEWRETCRRVIKDNPGLYGKPF